MTATFQVGQDTSSAANLMQTTHESVKSSFSQEQLKNSVINNMMAKKAATAAAQKPQPNNSMPPNQINAQNAPVDRPLQSMIKGKNQFICAGKCP